MPKWYKSYMLVAGVLGSIVPYVQAIEIFVSGSAENVSILAYILITIAMASWLLYGIFLKDIPMLVANSVGVAGCLFCIASILIYG